MLHLRAARRPFDEFLLAICCALIGALFDSALVALGWVGYTSGLFAENFVAVLDHYHVGPVCNDLERLNEVDARISITRCVLWRHWWAHDPTWQARSSVASC